MKTIGSALTRIIVYVVLNTYWPSFNLKTKSNPVWNWKNKVPPTIEHSPPIGHCNSSLFLFGFMVKIDLAKLKNRDANV